MIAASAEQQTHTESPPPELEQYYPYSLSMSLQCSLRLAFKYGLFDWTTTSPKATTVASDSEHVARSSPNGTSNKLVRQKNFLSFLGS